MEWQILLALLVIVPVILIPVALVWYLNTAGIYAAIKEARARRTVRQKERETVAETKA